MYNDFIQALQAQLQQPLPGRSSQEKMRPYLPMAPKMDIPQLIKPREGAVMAVFYPVNGQPHLLLTERPVYAGTHSGQISLPGGKLEADETHLDAARRETWEEVGVHPDELSVLGPLSKLYVPASNFNIQPFVAFADHQLNFRADEREVATLLETPLDLFFGKDIVGEKMMPSALGMKLMAPYYDIYNRTLWGATAMIMSELLQVINNSPQDFYKLIEHGKNR